MQFPKIQLPRSLELSLLIATLGYFIPFSIFFGQSAFTLFQAGLSLIFKGWTTLSSTNNVPSMELTTKLSGVIFIWSSLFSVGMVLNVFAAKRGAKLLRQIFTEFGDGMKFSFVYKLLMVTLLSAIFGMAFSASFYGFFSPLN